MRISSNDVVVEGENGKGGIVLCGYVIESALMAAGVNSQSSRGPARALMAA